MELIGIIPRLRGMRGRGLTIALNSYVREAMSASRHGVSGSTCNAAMALLLLPRHADASIQEIHKRSLLQNRFQKMATVTLFDGGTNHLACSGVP